MNENDALTLDAATGRVSEPNSPFLVFRLSWVSYVRESWAFLIRFFICGVAALGLSYLFYRGDPTRSNSWLSVLGLVVAILWTVYSVMQTQSVRLFTDERGVWVQSGVLPWQKGISGVLWRDLGQASYTQGMVSWALSSYDVRISHRFTTGAELYLRNVHRGNLAVEHVNAVMARLQGRVVPA